SFTARRPRSRSYRPPSGKPSFAKRAVAKWPTSIAKSATAAPFTKCSSVPRASTHAFTSMPTDACSISMNRRRSRRRPDPDAVMLRNVQGLLNHTLRAEDGLIGTVRDFYFDDHQWTVRYLVVGTGGWFNRQ